MSSGRTSEQGSDLREDRTGTWTDRQGPCQSGLWGFGHAALASGQLFAVGCATALSNADHCQLHVLGINGTGSYLASAELMSSSVNLEEPAGEHLSGVV